MVQFILNSTYENRIYGYGVWGDSLYTSGNIIKSMKAERFERRLYQASKLGKVGYFMNSSGNE